MTIQYYKRKILELEEKIRNREAAIETLVEGNRRYDERIRHYQYDISAYQHKISELLEKIERLEYKLNERNK